MIRWASLRFRLVVWTVSLEAVLLLAYSGFMVSVVQTTQERRIAETLRLSAAQLNAVVDVRSTGYFVPDDEKITLEERDISVWILSPDNMVVLRIGIVDNLPLPSVLPPIDQIAALNIQDKPVQVFVTRLKEGERVIGTLVLAIPLTENNQFLQEIILGLLVAVPLTLILSAIGGLFLANRALAPVAKITQVAQRVSASDLTQRLSFDLPNDEIGQLAHTFNAMLHTLEQAFQRERQLTSDVSHELRTPLGMLKTQLSLARSRSREAAELRQMMLDMEGDVDRMTRLVEQMLTLARVEQHGTSDPVQVDLGRLLRDIVGQFYELATERQVILSLELPDQVYLTVKGDAERLRQVFTNLIENAIKYANLGGQINVSINRHPNEISVAVRNTGEGIAGEHLPHLFERFYRVDNARARDTGGVGLGLAIAQAIIESHQGKIMVESQPGSSTTFNVVLPIAYSRLK